MNKFLITASGIVALATPAFAVFPFPLESDATGNILGGSWSGNGVIQANVTPGDSLPGGAGGNDPKILVDNFSGTGALTIDNMGSGVLPGGSEARLFANTSAIHTITLSGGSADLRLHNSNTFDDGRFLHNSVGLTGFIGVTSVSYKVSYSQPIASRFDPTASPSSRPMGAGLALGFAGTISGPDPTAASYNATLTYNQIAYSPTPNVPGSFTQAPIGLPLVQAGFNTPSSGATTFTSDGFTGLNQFLLVRGYDSNTDGTLDFDQTYVSEMTYTFQLDNGLAFPENALFLISMDGQQYSGFQNVIPEPTSIAMSLVALSSACFMRRRRA